MDKLWYLSKINLFEHLSKDELKEVAQATVMSTLPKGTIVQTPYGSPTGMYFIKEGKLRLYTVNEEGKQFTSGIMGMGGTFGNTSLFSFGTKDYYIETLTDTLICTFPSKTFEAFLMEHPALVISLMKSLSQKIEEQEKMLQQLALYDIKERLVFWLCRLAEDFGKEDGDYVSIELDLSHQELANMIGATRETVSVTLKELSNKGIILSGRLKVSIKKSIMKGDGSYEI